MAHEGSAEGGEEVVAVEAIVVIQSHKQFALGDTVVFSGFVQDLMRRYPEKKMVVMSSRPEVFQIFLPEVCVFDLTPFCPVRRSGGFVYEVEDFDEADVSEFLRSQSLDIWWLIDFSMRHGAEVRWDGQRRWREYLNAYWVTEVTCFSVITTCRNIFRGFLFEDLLMLWRGALLICDLNPYVVQAFSLWLLCGGSFRKSLGPNYKSFSRKRASPRPAIYINPTASIKGKRLSLLQWARLLKGCRFESGAELPNFVVNPGASEREESLAERIVAYMKRLGMNAEIGRKCLREMIEDIAECEAVFTVDSAVLHLALALGKPVRAIFVMEDPRYWMPPSELEHVIQNGEVTSRGSDLFKELVTEVMSKKAS